MPPFLGQQSWCSLGDKPPFLAPGLSWLPMYVLIETMKKCTLVMVGVFNFFWQDITFPNHAFLEQFFRTIGETASWTVALSLAQIKLSFIIIIVIVVIIIMDWLLMISVTKTYPQALPKGSWDGHHLFPGKNYCFMLTNHPRLPWTEIR